MRALILKMKPRQAGRSEGVSNDRPCRGRVIIKGKTEVDDEEDVGQINTCMPPWCRRHIIDMRGRGREFFEFPSEEKVLQDISTMIAEGRVGVPEGSADCSCNSSAKMERRRHAEGMVVKALKGSDDYCSKGFDSPTPPVATTSSPPLRADSNAQLVASEVMRQRFEKEKWRAAVAKKFNAHRNTLRRARKAYPLYRVAIDNLEHHVSKLSEFYEDKLPKVYVVLHIQYPDASEADLRAASVQALDQQEELSQALYVLDRYVLAFEQLEDPDYEPLKVIIYTDAEAFNLFLTGNIAGDAVPEGEVVDTIDFTVGNIFLAYAGEGGLATIPGVRGPSGPLGVHLLLIPADELGSNMLVIAVNPHELYHDIRPDIPGLADEEVNAEHMAILAAHKSGRVKLSADKIVLGKTTLNLIDLIAKIYLDNLEEISADLVGGIEMCGWAYALCMLNTFVAYNCKKDGVIATKDRLRTSSTFEINKKNELWFEEHPVDYVRMFIITSALELLGFGDEARAIREMADRAINFSCPEFIIWEDINGKRPPIQIRTSDLEQLAPVVVEALLKTPFNALKGKSHHDRIAWTRKRQAKVDVLVETLVQFIRQRHAGCKVKLELPGDIGDVYGIYVAAAASICFYRLIAEGAINPSDVAVLVNDAAMQMARLCMQQQKTGGKLPPSIKKTDSQLPNLAPDTPTAPAARKRRKNK